jgi:hypothetical protein
MVTVTRGIDADLLAALSAPQFYPVLLAYIDWPDGALRVHSGVGDISFDGEAWLGVGKLGSVSIPAEGSGIVPGEIQLTLQAPLADLLDLATETEQRGHVVQVWVGCTETPGRGPLIGTPVSGFYGTITGTPFRLRADGSLSEISVVAAGGPPARAEAEVVHSDADQQALFSGDTFFRRIAHAEKVAANPPQW